MSDRGQAIVNILGTTFPPDSGHDIPDLEQCFLCVRSLAHQGDVC